MEGERDHLRQLEVKIREEAIPLREKTSLGDKQIVGREIQTKNFIQMLLKEGPGDENYEVISIVGKGGLGKTTLAQYVYNHVQVNDHFKALKAWVSMPETEHLDLTHVMTNVINSAMKNKLTFGDLNLTQDKLLEVVKDKRFLIVLDDVWSMEPYNWEKLKRPFQHGAKGSKVIITTRFEKVATVMREKVTQNIIHLEDFSDNECWVLFERHAKLGSDTELLEMRSEIIRKCSGLPLAAKALGCLFSECQDQSQFREILNSNIWCEEGQVLPVLRLSYFHLPLHLKPLFAYFALFPKGYRFSEMEIILLWMAQGMLLPKNQEGRMEAIGHRYFLQLVSSSLVERSSFNQERYIIHDLVYDLSVWAAGEICIRYPGSSQKQEQLTRTRHLCLYTNDIDQIDQLPCTRHLRTFMGSPKVFVDRQKLNAFILSLRSIRTLFLASSTIEELPSCIGDLKFLWFLDLQFKKITSLPESIGRLYNLQVLFLTGCINLEKGIDFGSLVKLRHVCFPKSLWEAMPWGIDKLTNLQTLGVMYLRYDNMRGSMIRELKNLNHLHGELTVIGINHVTGVEDAQEMHLDEKSGLEKLCLKWSSAKYVHDHRVLEQLKPNSCIKEYMLEGYMGSKLPSWLGDPAFKNMVEIRLVKCCKCEQLPPLWQLPSLKKLWVTEMKYLEGFLDDFMEKFSFLEELVIKGCKLLQGTLQSIPSCLKILTIENCPKAKVSLASSPKFEVLKVASCEALLLSTDMLVIHCSEKLHLEKIKWGFTKLQVDGPCRQGLVIRECNSLVSIEKIPVSVEKVQVDRCTKLEKVEWEEASASSASNNNGVSINISDCDSVVCVGNIPLVVSKLEIFGCKSLEGVMFDVWGDNKSGPPQLELAQLLQLYISWCPKLMFLKQGLLMPSLQRLTILKIPKFHISLQGIHEWGLNRFTNLKRLTIEDIGQSGDSIECITGTYMKDDEGTILHLPSTSLCELSIKGFKNLKTIKCSTFPNLTTFEISDCQNFANFKDREDYGQLQVAPIQQLNIQLMSANKPIQKWGLDLLKHLQQLKLYSICWRGGAVEYIVGKNGTVDDTSSTTPSCSTLYLPSFSLRKLTIDGEVYPSTSDSMGSFSDLKSINCSTFPNLTWLVISNCPKLESLSPDNYLSPKFNHVEINGHSIITSVK